MSIWKKAVALLCGSLLFCCLTACEQEGPAERAGEKVDETVEEAKKTIEEAGDKMQETAEKAGEKIEEAGEEMQH